MQNDSFMMTERDWFASTDSQEMHRTCPNIDPNRMLQFLRGVHKVDRIKHGRRRLRLFACGCCRQFWAQLSDESREAIEIAERYADGKAGKKEMGFAWRTTNHEFGSHERTADHIAGHVVEASAMTAAVLTAMLSYTVWNCSKPPVGGHGPWKELSRQASIIRDIFVNPFRPIVFKSVWLTSAVTATASSIYEEHAFHRLPELRERLEDAGCDNLEILNHCRSQEPHVRGCWVIDLILANG